MGQALAVDIPMDARLAAERLEAKTCYSVLTYKGRLVGYELGGELLVSSAGRLAAVPSASSHDVGDGMPRRYEGGGLSFDIKPLSDEKTETVKDITYTIKERAVAVLVEKGKRRRFKLDVLLSCA
ncbi:hypothetical protein D0T23_09160 [Duganella sp. BJB475]|nr:hypothetical protein D0T23_09160 [Duganella sp. BJB475]RFP32783.1 hypothetical protein D0T21_11475 [Duganella sp. BJB476]